MYCLLVVSIVIMANEYEPALYNVLSIGCVDSDIYDMISEKQKCEFRKWSSVIGCVDSKKHYSL